MKHIFIFSSPLQYMFANLIAAHLPEQADIEGYYYVYQNDFTPVYKAIDDLLGFRLPKKDISQLDSMNIDQKTALYFTNRYNAIETKLYYALKPDVGPVYLYEEGANFYLDHFFLDENLNDRNRMLKFKNRCRRVFGKTPSHLYLDQFDKIYSVFQEVPGMRRDQSIIIAPYLQALTRHKSGSDNSSQCLLLSQWFVEHEILSHEQYVEYISGVIRQLSGKYQTIYYKEHPRDPASLTEEIFHCNPELKSPITPYDTVPVELFLVKNNIDLYGFWSSAMFYSSSVFGTRTFSLYQDIVNHFPDNEKLRQMYDGVQALFRKHAIKEVLL